MWRNHSLTIVLWAVGTALVTFAFGFEPGRVFDLLLTMGGGALTVALFNTLAGSFTERNKPETR